MSILLPPTKQTKKREAKKKKILQDANSKLI